MIAYRVLVFALLAAVTYYFTGNASQTTVISVVFNVAGSLAYYVYERLWDAIPWGKSAPGILSGRVAITSTAASQNNNTQPTPIKDELTNGL